MSSVEGKLVEWLERHHRIPDDDPHAGGEQKRFLKEVIAEIRRLKEGNFSEEEFQNLCHGFDESDADRFALGCREYQRKLFGRCAWSNRSLTGTAMVIRDKEGQILVQQRRGTLGYGTWSVPGGWVELGEPPLKASVREAFEEVGVVVHKARLLGVTSYVEPSTPSSSGGIWALGIGTITVWYEAESWDGIPEIREPDKMMDMGWYPIYNVPKPRYTHLTLACEQGIVGVI